MKQVALLRPLFLGGRAREARAAAGKGLVQFSFHGRLCANFREAFLRAWNEVILVGVLRRVAEQGGEAAERRTLLGGIGS